MLKQMLVEAEDAKAFYERRLEVMDNDKDRVHYAQCVASNEGKIVVLNEILAKIK